MPGGCEGRGRKGRDPTGLLPVPAHRARPAGRKRKCILELLEQLPPLASRPVSRLGLRLKRGRTRSGLLPRREGGGLSQPSQGAWGLGQQADWQGGAAFDPGHFSQSSSSDSGWHCVSRSAGASPRREARLSPERWAASAGKTPFPLLQAAEH